MSLDIWLSSGATFIHECPTCKVIHEDRCSWDEYCPDHTTRSPNGWGPLFYGGGG